MTTQDKLAEALLARIHKAWAEDGKVSISMRDVMELCEQVSPTVIQQAQPPAARVTDAMQELADKYHELLWAVARKFPGETRHETALRYIREAECQEAALAAQENPNG